MNILNLKATILNKLLDIIKIYKTEIIFVDLDGKVYGYDSELNYMVESNIILDLSEWEGYHIPLIFECLEFKNFMKDKENVEIIKVEYGNQYFLSDSEYRLKSLVYLYSKLNSINNIAFEPRVGCESYLDVQSEPQFINMIKAKASVGAVKIQYGNHKMIVMKSLYSINSSDKVDIHIYNVNHACFNTEFVIKKKGNITLKQHMKFLSI